MGKIGKFKQTSVEFWWSSCKLATKYFQPGLAFNEYDQIHWYVTTFYDTSDKQIPQG